MPVLEANGRPYEEVDGVGLVILRTREDRLHSGILYRIEGEGPRMLHLAFHYDLRDEEARLPYRWAQLGLDDVNRLVLSEIVSRVARQRPGIAYGFDASGVCIDAKSGDVIPAPPGKGLTCATFISAILAAHGYSLIDLESWPLRADDEQFQQEIIDFLVQHQADPEHIAAVRGSVGSKRLRPDEAVGAGTLKDDEWAVQFAEARALADEILIELA